MKKPALIFLITILIISQIAVITHANEKKENINNKTQVSVSQKDDKIKAKIELEQDDEDENENKVKVEIKNGKDKEKTLIKIEKKEFKIWGKITSYIENSLIKINGQEIKIDKSVTKELKIVGNVKIGMYAKVEGDIINNNMYAEKIIINNREKVEVSAIPSISPTATPSVALSPSISPSASPSPTNESVQENDISKPVLQQLIKALEDLIKSLKGI